MMESIKELLQKEAAAVLNIPVGNEYEKAINMIVEQVHNKGGKLVHDRHGQGRTNSNEHCHYLLFYRNTFRISSSK